MKKKIILMAGALSPLALVGQAFAATPDVAGTMTTAFQGIQTQFMQTVEAVAPIGLGIAGTFLVWKYGKRFFNAISK